MANRQRRRRQTQPRQQRQNTRRRQRQQQRSQQQNQQQPQQQQQRQQPPQQQPPQENTDLEDQLQKHLNEQNMYNVLLHTLLPLQAALLVVGAAAATLGYLSSPMLLGGYAFIVGGIGAYIFYKLAPTFYQYSTIPVLDGAAVAFAAILGSVFHSRLVMAQDMTTDMPTDIMSRATDALNTLQNVPLEAALSPSTTFYAAFGGLILPYFLLGLFRSDRTWWLLPIYLLPVLLYFLLMEFGLAILQ